MKFWPKSFRITQWYDGSMGCTTMKNIEKSIVKPLKMNGWLKDLEIILFVLKNSTVKFRKLILINTCSRILASKFRAKAQVPRA